MLIKCPISSAQYSVPGFTQSVITEQHPIFSLPLPELINLANNCTCTAEAYLCTLALLDYCPFVHLSSASQYTQEIGLQCQALLSDTITIVQSTAIIYAEHGASFNAPIVHIGAEHCNNIAELPSIISLYSSAISDWRDNYATAQLNEQLAELEHSMLKRMAPVKLVQWATLAASLNTEQSALCAAALSNDYSIGTLLNADYSSTAQLLEHLEVSLPLGNRYTHALLGALRKLCSTLSEWHVAQPAPHFSILAPQAQPQPVENLRDRLRAKLLKEGNFKL